MLDHHRGYIIADSDFFDTLIVLLPLFNSDLGVVITTIITHKVDELAEQALELAHKYHRQTCMHLGDLVLERLLASDRSLIALIKQQFREIPHELMVTALVFIESGLNATRASKKLYVHRNTFNYRLAKFIEKTSLDIRDYHHALYFKMVNKVINM